VGEGGHLAGHAAQAEARAGVEVGGLQPAVVEAERLGHPMLQVKLAIVVAGEMLGGERGGLGRIERCGRGGRGGSRLAHWACGWSAGPPSSTKRRSQ
jgi:hypothetical protein